MQKTLVRCLAFLGVAVVGFMTMATVAEARSERSSQAGARGGGSGGPGAPMPSMMMTQFGRSCGVGQYHLGEEVALAYEVSFSVEIDETSGYLVDCMQGADAYLEFHSAGNGLYVYAVWGQLGSLSWDLL